MDAPSRLLLLLLASLLLLQPSAAQGDFTPSYSFLIDCGSATNSTIDGRVFEADAYSSSLLSAPQHVMANTSVDFAANVSAAPLLETVRIFPNTSTYTFSVAPSRYWIRLYFYPFKYESYELNSAVFSVSANQYTLLADVNVASLIKNYASGYLFKEYSVNVSDATLTISFIPSINSYAFINAMEVLSMPSDIIVDDSISLTTLATQPLGLVNTVLECLFRVNVGGPLVSAANDSVGLFRTWLANESFLSSSAGVMNVSTTQQSIIYPTRLPGYVAPSVVYSTALQMADSQTIQNSFNISWRFSIDAEFLYVVRLHFCEIYYTTAAQRIFDVYLQNQTADRALDLVRSNQADNALYKDFTVNSTGGITSLWIQVGPTPNTGTSSRNAILNGIEIWKLNNSAGSLDGEIPLPPSTSRPGRNVIPVVGGVVGGVIAISLIAVGICLFCRRKPKVYKHPRPAWLPLPLHGWNSTSMASKMSNGSHKSGTGSHASSGTSLGRFFTFTEIQEATNSFDEARILGVGGFGKVYKGELEDGTVIAVKRGNTRSEQGITEFQAEIQMLSKLRHRHLVSLIGFCDEFCEMILVYECMAKGSLRSHLYGSDLPPLTWTQRLEICIGAARGLHYLHTGAAQGIIHRDVKTTNILLDENLVAKVADFGLSKTGPTVDRTHVSTVVKGTFGYLDPEYYRRQQLTEKSDVYSFGVVLLEVLCARPVINPALPRDQVNLAEWAMQYQIRGLLAQIVDSHLSGTVNTESLKKFGETAEKCLAEEGMDRPGMGDVLWNLEYALQLQETAMANDLDDDSRNRILELPVRLPAQEHWDVITEPGNSLTSMLSEEGSEDTSGSAVFSQLVKPHGR